MGTVGMGGILPFLPLYVRELGITDPEQNRLWSGMVFSAPFLFGLLVGPYWGSLADRYGQKLMLLRAFAGLAVAIIAMGFARTPEQFLVLRVLQGLVSGFIAAGISFVSHHTPPERSAWALGVLQTSSSTGSILGPLIGGVIADTVGMREVFFIVGAVLVVATVLVLLFIHEPRIDQSSVRHATVRENVALVWRTPRLRSLALQLMVGQMVVIAAGPLMPFLVEERGAPAEYLATITGALVGVVGITALFSAPWWGKRTDTIGPRAVLWRTLPIAACATAVQPFLPSYHYLIGTRLMVGLTLPALMPLLLSSLSREIPLGRRAGVLAVGNSASQLGHLIAPTLAGLVAAQFGITTAFVALAVLTLAPIGLIGGRAEERSPGS